jgi:hypothetical protein
MTTSLDPRLANPDAPEGEEEHGRYRALSAMAVASLVLGVFSLLTVWHWAFGLFSAAGILTGYTALRQIRKAPEELVGVALAWAGIVLSVAFAALGYSLLLFVRAGEFPYGYERINYEMLQPDPDAPRERIPPAAYARQYDQVRNNKVGLKGYMYPARQSTGLKTFLLCPAIPNCPFCAPNPKPTEIIRVKLEGDLKARYTNHLIRVGGKFRVDESAPGGIPYELDADFLVQPR